MPWSVPFGRWGLDFFVGGGDICSGRAPLWHFFPCKYFNTKGPNTDLFSSLSDLVRCSFKKRHFVDFAKMVLD